ncbi:hypothetical protein EB795_31765 [Pseudomonas mandelii]|uniref:hypothetical protein n=1 Tax=Pseudomonas mandelii TaxID=75612 RepID=UPI0012B38828|nr:hypothetical protein [Pseudomonas mandelii]MSU98443.1 hypothetical protein [Pseudomonas mandelii]
MQQGSEVIPTHLQHPAELSGALIVQQRRVVALREVSSLTQSMQLMALYCIDQNHVTLDHMEAMADTLGMLRRQIEELRNDLASH